MVKGENGAMSLDVRTAVDKGVSTFVLCVCVKIARRAVLSIRCVILYLSNDCFLKKIHSLLLRSSFLLSFIMQFLSLGTY